MLLGHDAATNLRSVDTQEHDDPQNHVQYTQTDTIRQTDCPLVPMVRLVPIENDVSPMVLLVNMHLMIVMTE